MLVAGRWIALAVILGVIARSYRVADSIFWNKATEEPLTPEAERYAARRGVTPAYVALQVTWPGRRRRRRRWRGTMRGRGATPVGG